MNIKARINARKILLVYFYEQYFFLLAWKKKKIIDHVDKIRKIVANPSEVENEEDIDLSEIFSDDYYGDFDKEITYIIQNYFSKISQDDIDYDYVRQVGPHFDTFKEEVQEEVDKHAVTFWYNDMDLMDRVLFVLWYIEYKIVKTPKEVILNEMVELAKRYWDESSPKLINGIGHKIFASLSKQDEKKK